MTAVRCYDFIDFERRLDDRGRMLRVPAHQETMYPNISDRYNLSVTESPTLAPTFLSPSSTASIATVAIISLLGIIFVFYCGCGPLYLCCYGCSNHTTRRRQAESVFVEVPEVISLNNLSTVAT
ncbi:hypothetical protein HPB51_023511 [Rhipicephalus microplus]|uniref:Uncharacterized protein n=1 Tax=Rhipicephalus microplus TaxID=6941 RepID=A0A9J6EJU3_RHIMP|nr:hypothetical protein HPB51_023511 [Rhipicephalus microplus]